MKETTSQSEKNRLHLKAEKLRIEKKQIIYHDPWNDDGSRKILQREINAIRKEHRLTWSNTQFYNDELGIDPHGIAKYYPKNSNKGTGEIKKTTTTATTPTVTPAPSPPKKIKTIEETVNEFDGDKAFQGGI